MTETNTIKPPVNTPSEYRDVALGHLFVRVAALVDVAGKALEAILAEEAAERAEATSARQRARDALAAR
jgi:hypothetical protein